MRAGILGAGPIAQFAHLDACRRARNVELYAVCDVARDLLDRVRAVHQPACTYSSYEDMLSDGKVEAIIIATTDAFHVPLAARAVAAGKHVLVEKPLGITIEECDALAASVRKSGIAAQVGFNNRFEPSLAFAKRFVDAEMGKRAVFNAWYCDSVDRYTMTDNLQPIPLRSLDAKKPDVDPKADKRRYFLATHGSHLVDMAQFMAGSISAVCARWQESAAAHTWSVELEFDAGCLGHLTLIIPARSDFQTGVQLFGEGGSVQGRLYLPWYRKAGDIECFSNRDGLYRRPLGADADTYKLQLESFADVILKGNPLWGASIDSGVENMRALVAIAKSCETGGWVRLADVSGGI